MRHYLRFFLPLFLIFYLVLASCQMGDMPSAPDTPGGDNPPPVVNPFPDGFKEGPDEDIGQLMGQIQWVAMPSEASQFVVYSEKGLFRYYWRVGSIWDELISQLIDSPDPQLIFATNQNLASPIRMVTAIRGQKRYSTLPRTSDILEQRELLDGNIESFSFAPVLYPTRDALAMILSTSSGRKLSITGENDIDLHEEWQIAEWGSMGMVLLDATKTRILVRWQGGIFEDFFQRSPEVINGVVQSGSDFLIVTNSGLKRIVRNTGTIGVDEVVIKPFASFINAASNKDEIIVVAHSQETSSTDCVSFYVPKGTGYEKVAGIGWLLEPTHCFSAVFAPDSKQLAGIFYSQFGIFIQVFKVKEDGSLIVSSKPLFVGQAQDAQEIEEFQNALRVHGKLAAF